ncbi:MAG: hypothetical protein AB1768_15875 [Pseudomonadota bacterium]|jgi:hypothetical protein
MDEKEGSASIEAAEWQDLLQQAAAAWPAVATRLSIGFLGRADHGARRGRLLPWPPTDGGPARWRDYRGEAQDDLGLLLVLDEAEAVSLCRGGLAFLPTMVRRGKALPYVLRSADELEAAGLMEFVEDLGLVFPKH